MRPAFCHNVPRVIQLLAPMDGLPHPLGRHVEHDERSRGFAYEPDATAPQPVLWQHTGPVLNQHAIGSCTGNALTQSLMTGPLYRKGFTASEAKAVRLYELATQLDGIPGEYPPTDTGSSGIGACKAARQMGWISSYQHVFGIDHAELSIVTTPFIVGTAWYEGMFTPDVTGMVHPTGQVAGGHEYLCLGFDGADTWTFLNSWGPHFGVAILHIAVGGLFHMSTADFAALLADQGDISVPVR